MLIYVSITHPKIVLQNMQIAKCDNGRWAIHLTKLRLNLAAHIESKPQPMPKINQLIWMCGHLYGKRYQINYSSRNAISPTGFAWRHCQLGRDEGSFPCMDVVRREKGEKRGISMNFAFGWFFSTILFGSRAILT